MIALSAFAVAAYAPDASAKDEPRIIEADNTPPPPPSSSSSPSDAAAVKPVVVWPTLTPAGDDTGTVSLHKPTASEGRVHARAQELDATLRDAVQDLGFTLDLADEGPTGGRTRDLDLLVRLVVHPLLGHQAERPEAIPRIAAPRRALEREVQDDTRAGHPDGVAERDRAAVHVDAIVGDPETVHRRDRDGGEGLVDLDQVEVGHGQPGLVQRVLDRVGRLRLQ